MKKKIIIALTAILAVLGIVSVEVIQTVYAQSDDTHIYEGVYVEDVSLGNMTKKEAKTALNRYIKKLKDKKVTLKTAAGSLEATLGDLGLTYDSNSTIDEAYSYGKVGNIIRRYKEQKDIEKDPVKLKLTKAVNAKTMKKYLKDNSGELVQGAKNASIKRVKGAFQIIPEQIGQQIDYKSTRTSFITYLNEEWNGQDFSYELAVKTEEPKYKSEDLANVKDKLGTYTTNFSSSTSDRAANVTNGANLINGSVVYPGEIFSVYDVVSPFTTANGYFIGKAYANGEVVDSIGGGICQVSTTLYNAVLRAELEVTQRAPHSMVVTYVPRAADAAIAGTYKDLKFKNNSDSPIYIEGSSYNRNITFTIYGHETRPANRKLEFRSVTLATYNPGKDIETKNPTMDEGKMIVTQSAHIGYKAQYWKDIYVDGKKTDSILVNTSTYQASPRRVMVGSKKKPEEKKPEEKDKTTAETTTQKPPTDKTTAQKPTTEAATATEKATTEKATTEATASDKKETDQ